jgi:hypothetical protein
MDWMTSASERSLPSRRAATGGAAGVEKLMGVMPSRSPSAAASPSARVSSPSPVAMGFMTRKLRPWARQARAMAHATRVLPTPVSVPVMNSPRISTSPR